jgi:hypothetical protein
MDEQRPVVEKLLDLVVSAPAGLVGQVRELPKLIADGRTKLENRVRVAHWIGEMAVTTGRKEIGRRMAAARPTTGATQPAPEAGGHRHPPFDGYDTLPAAEIVKLLARLPRPDLELIREYEAAGRARRTILGRVAELSGD